MGQEMTKLLRINEFLAEVAGVIAGTALPRAM